MRTRDALVAWVILAAALAACTSSSPSSDSWSRSYLLPIERVEGAAVEVLEEEGYLVDIDRKSGQVTAEPSRFREQKGPILTVRVNEKQGRVRVDVQTRLGTERTTATSNRDQAAVLEFLHGLDQKLRLPDLEPATQAEPGSNDRISGTR